MSEFQCAINTTPPPSPPAGTISMYVKADGLWYYKDAAGVEKPVAEVASVAGKTGAVTLVSADVGLGAVNNTTDLAKPLSTATQTGLDVKLNIINVPITAFLPPITIVASDDFDNSQDSTWIDRCADKSWELEARSGTILATSNYANATAAVAAGIVTGDGYYNTTNSRFEEVTGATTSIVTYRAGSSKFPMTGVVTAEAGRVIIWDITSGQPEMWMVFDVGNLYILHSSSSQPSSVAYSNGVLVVGCALANGRCVVIDFNRDKAVSYHSTGFYTVSSSIAQRNQAGVYTLTDPLGGIVNNTVNSVAITYLDDAPLDDYGMRVPTIAVGTDDGVSVIKHDGSVVTPHTAGLYSIQHVSFLNDALLLSRDGGGSNWVGNYYLRRDWEVSSVTMYFTSPSMTWLNPRYNVFPNATQGQKIYSLGQMIGFVISDRLALIKVNPTTPSSGMVAYLTNTYNTGWMVGDIRRAIGYDSNSVLADRSVKAGAPAEVGTLTKTAVAGGRTSVSGFSATNYIQEPTSADFNAIGTGDFSITMTGVKWGTAAAANLTLLSLGLESLGGLLIWRDSSHRMQVRIHDGVAYNNTWTSNNASLNDSLEHTVIVSRKSGTITLYIDGNTAPGNFSGSMASTISSATGALRIGLRQLGGNPWTGGAFTTFNLSATATSPDQAKFIAVQEEAIKNGAKCLLSSSPSVTDLKYNKQHDTYYVKNGSNMDEFKGLQRTDSMALATGVTTSGNPLAAPVLSATGTTNIFKAPAVDINSSIKALGRRLADAKQGTIIKTITSSAASVLTMPQGFKPIRVTSATGTYVALSTNAPKYDGFIWSITTGLAANTAYDVEMRRV